MEPEPELDVRFGDAATPPTPWANAQSAIEAAELFWIASVRVDGRPHVTPLPAVWHEGRLHFCTGLDEQKAVNIANNPHVALTTGRNLWKEGLDVVVEGIAVRVTDPTRLRVLANLWRVKYDGDWDFTVDDQMFQHDGGSAAVFEVAPTKVWPSRRAPSPRRDIGSRRRRDAAPDCYPKGPGSRDSSCERGGARHLP